MIYSDIVGVIDSLNNTLKQIFESSFKKLIKLVFEPNNYGDFGTKY